MEKTIEGLKEAFTLNLTKSLSLYLELKELVDQGVEIMGEAEKLGYALGYSLESHSVEVVELVREGPEICF